MSEPHHFLRLLHDEQPRSFNPSPGAMICHLIIIPELCASSMVLVRFSGCKYRTLCLLDKFLLMWFIWFIIPGCQNLWGFLFFHILFSPEWQWDRSFKFVVVGKDLVSFSSLSGTSWPFKTFKSCNTIFCEEGKK